MLINHESGIVNVSGAQLYFRAAGEGDPLVLIHGFGLDHRMWDPQVEAFATRWRVIRYDMRGFGRSSLPKEGQPYSHAEDLAGLFVELGIERAHLCGLSLGGEVAIDFTLRYPQAVTSLTLADSMLDGFAWSELQRSMDGEVWQTGRDVGVDAARLRWRAHPLFVPLMERPEAWGLFEAMVADYSGWHWQHRNPATWVEPDAIEWLGQIAVPALVVAGERDLPDFLEITDMLAWGIPRARKMMLPGAGHLVNMETPDEFNRACLTFLATH